jgi:hypothetical protein
MVHSSWKTLVAAALTAWFTPAIVSGSAQAQPRGVVELFTSEGCSSCPPADRLLTELAHDPSLVALAWHIDYWDYLGWKDTFSNPAFTARQQGYAKARGDGQVYTPQVVVNGTLRVVGSERAAIEAAISSRRVELTVPITLQGGGSMVRVSIGAAAAGGPRTGTLYFLPVLRSRQVSIGRGENANRAILYANIVRAMIPFAMWSGDAKSVDIPLENMGDADGYVVLLQVGSRERPGVVLGAVKGPGL